MSFRSPGWLAKTPVADQRLRQGSSACQAAANPRLASPCRGFVISGLQTAADRRKSADRPALSPSVGVLSYEAPTPGRSEGIMGNSHPKASVSRLSVTLVVCLAGCSAPAAVSSPSISARSAPTFAVTDSSGHTLFSVVPAIIVAP